MKKLLSLYSVSQKNPPSGLRFSDVFHKRLIVLHQFFYTPIIHSYLR